MDLSALAVTLRAAELGSFAAAAREAGLDPSSASRAVASVEHRLGMRLFQRSTRRLSLTAEGEDYLRRVAPLLEAMEEARETARGGRAAPGGRLRLTASTAYGARRIVPRLAALRRAAPNLEVELILSDANLDMVAERIDLAVRLAPAPEGDLISSKLHDTRYRVVAAPAWLAAHGAPETPRDLAGTACLRSTLRGHRDAWTFRPHGGEGWSDVTVAVEGPILVSSATALLEAARAGLGPALLADWLVEDALTDGGLRDLFPRYAVTATTFGTAAWLLYTSRTYLPAKIRVAVDVLRAKAG